MIVLHSKRINNHEKGVMFVFILWNEGSNHFLPLTKGTTVISNQSINTITSLWCTRQGHITGRSGAVGTAPGCWEKLQEAVTLSLFLF